MLTVFTRLANELTYGWFGLTAESKLGDAVHFFIEDTTKIFVLLAAMIFVVGFLRAGVDATRVRDWLKGKNRFLGYVLAAILGAVTPFCSCSSIPLFLGFTAARIPVGITMAFLITSPCVNEAAVVLFGSSLGWGLAALYVGLGLAAGILGGLFFDAIGAERYLEVSSLTATSGCGCSCGCGKRARLEFGKRLKIAADETKTILGRIWVWVIVGIALGAGLHGYVPEGFVAAHLGGGEWWSVPLAVAIGIPTYANVTSVIPVTSELINQGLPVGTALAFMLATAAASVPEFVMLKKVMSVRLLVLFGGYLLVAFMLCGWTLNAIF